MSLFDGREKGAEGQTAHDAEVNFKVAAKRNHLMGLWAAQAMGFDKERAEGYAHDLVILHLEYPDAASLAHKVHRDMEDARLSYSLTQILKQLDYFDQDARQSLFN